MSFSDFITDYGKSISKSHFVTLIQICRIDGKISPPELAMLHREGKKFGLTEPEVDKLIEAEKYHVYHTPYSLEEKFEQLYNVAAMILADDVVTEEEKKAIRRIATESGLSDAVLDDLREILLDGIKNNTDEDVLFRKFKNTVLKRDKNN